jgi:hypothetical protein
MKKKVFAAFAFTIMLLAAPVVQAQNLVDLFIWKRSHWELTAGVGLLGTQTRTVYNQFQPALGAAQLYQTPRHQYFRTNYVVDFDFKNNVRIHKHWAIVYGFGAGLFNHDLYLDDYYYDVQSSSYSRVVTEGMENYMIYSIRLLLGIGYNFPITDGKTINVKAYGGLQPSGIELDRRQWTSFGDDLIHLRHFAGGEIQFVKDLKSQKILIPHASIGYRYMHFLGGKDYLASHTITGLHQIVIGWGLRQNPKADKSAYDL